MPRSPSSSAACASGLHALWLGATWLAAGHDEVIVLAVDVLSRPGHDHFEGLRVLATDPAPWQPTASGFIPGEAAVALRLRRVTDAATRASPRAPTKSNEPPISGLPADHSAAIDALGHDVASQVPSMLTSLAQPRDGAESLGAWLPIITGPALAHDRENVDALGELARTIAAVRPELVIGQGTGPVAVDDRELAAIRTTVSPQVPLTTALTHFGHIVGASGLLSVALAALGQHARIPSLAMSHATASDGRVLGVARGAALVTCRALGGACAALGISGSNADDVRPLPAECGWSTPAPPPPLRMPLLRRLAEEAIAHRPEVPPGVVLVRLDEPLVPPDDARIGGRLLPSVVLEMTPGFLAQLVARAWGYGGPALCVVGGTEACWEHTLATCRQVHGSVAVLHVHRRDFEWRS